MSLAITFQEYPSDNCSLYSALTDFAAEDIPSVNPADQGTIQVVSPSQRQEFALKQVSHLV
jgi:hypothetical protein